MLNNFGHVISKWSLCLAHLCELSKSRSITFEDQSEVKIIHSTTQCHRFREMLRNAAERVRIVRFLRIHGPVGCPLCTADVFANDTAQHRTTANHTGRYSRTVYVYMPRLVVVGTDSATRITRRHSNGRQSATSPGRWYMFASH